MPQEGPDHCKIFEAKVEWKGQCLGLGTGNSKKEAEIEAARSALKNSELHELAASELSGLGR